MTPRRTFRRKPAEATSPLTSELFHRIDTDKLKFEILAQICGMSRAQIAAYRSGKHVPSVDRFQDLAKAAGYEVILRPVKRS